jgi:putative transposase
MAIPYRGLTSQSTYFITGNVLEKKSLFQVEKIARLFIEVMMEYRQQRKYQLHEFVVMPDHFHLILSPIGITLERAMQLIKGGFSFQLTGISGESVTLGSPALWIAVSGMLTSMRRSRTISGRIR